MVTSSWKPTQIVLGAPRAPLAYIWGAQILLWYSSLSLHQTETSSMLSLGMIHFCTSRVKHSYLEGSYCLNEKKRENK